MNEFLAKFHSICRLLRSEGMRYPIVSFGLILPWTRCRIPALMLFAQNDNRRPSRRDRNKMLIDRIQGAPAQPMTPETENDPRNPNVPDKAGK